MDVRGEWFGHEIEPMDEYSPHAAKALIDERLPYRNESVTDADFFDKKIDEFITAERQALTDDMPLPEAEAE